MPEESKETVLSRFRELLKTGNLADDVSIVYRLHGGAPGKQVDESVVLTSDGRVRVLVSDALGRKLEGDAGDDLGREAALDLARTIEAGIDDLIPQSEARFVPDSLVGSVSIGIGDEVETYYFDADEEAAAHEGSEMPSGVRSITRSFDSIEKRCLENAAGEASGKESGR